MTMFCATQIGQVMLSLPRANYLTSAAAGLPLMLVRLPYKILQSISAAMHVGVTP